MMKGSIMELARSRGKALLLGVTFAGLIGTLFVLPTSGQQNDGKAKGAPGAAKGAPGGGKGAAKAIEKNVPKYVSFPGFITGTVTGERGPEAGVWVIAETNDLPTKLIKIVVTDDQGRYA